MVPMEPAYLLGTGGAIGAVLRYLVSDLVVRQQGDMQFPLSTLVVNVIGSFVLGVVVFGNFSEAVTLFFGVGLCGAFTTYSSFSVQTVRLWERGMGGAAVLNAVGNFVLSVAAAGLAWLIIG
ncbi:CrcB protein [Halohasta litchfieldiae]|jgi:CrcB protein|uniref:Fluoride-specific ion channel FluC n=1 Tax=Halohasta litchfieldiae TaxID=1073996 RepID=A0A1H6WNS7_9EURY|nr:fluoride efflux transporter CrcB [Halohasta litchfieldiae]ATW90018.1 CrcB protein [Halohasta litchfieldiae]SEJ14132.1 camphor resistance protein CrcB [Halohasta litchfieldiae]